MEAIHQDTSDFGVRMKQRLRDETQRMGRYAPLPEEVQEMELPEALDQERTHNGGVGSAASSPSAVTLPGDDDGLGTDVDIGTASEKRLEQGTF